MRTRVPALLAGLVLLFSTQPAGAVSEITRLAGLNRYDTAAEVSCCNIDGSTRTFTTIVLATGQHFPDALVGNYLAGIDNGILLLTDGETISDRAEEIVGDAPPDTIANIYVLGSEEVVSDAAVDELVAALPDGEAVRTTRIAGETDIDTAVDVARFRPTSIGGTSDSSKYAIVATIGGFADSLAAAPIAFSSRFPILYARPDDLPPQTKDALDDLGITNVLIVGGTAAIDNEVQTEITELGIEVERLAGATRQETAVEVAEWALSNDAEFDGQNFSLARGDNFADALSGGVHAGFIGSPILLSQSSTQLGFAAAGFLQRQSGTLERGWAYGGTGALSDDVLEQARIASDGATP